MDRPELERQLWELIYDLLPADEAARLTERITSDPEVARAYADARLRADLLSEAVRLEQEPIELPRRKTSRTNGAPVTALDRAAFALNVLVSIAAVVLLGVTFYLYARPNSPIRPVAVRSAERQLLDQHVNTVLVGPARVQAGLPQNYEITTTALDGTAKSANVTWQLYDDQGGLRLDRRLQTDTDGRATISVPPDVISANSKLEVETEEVAEGRLVARLQTEGPRYATWLTLDKPLYRPGETVYFRSLTLSRFNLQARRDMLVEYEILDGADLAVPESRSVGLTEQGVGNGVFAIPPHFAGGRYSLVARSPGELFSEARREFQVRQYRTPRLKQQLELTRDSYAPGDEVLADLSVARAEGGPVANAPLRVQVIVDGKPLSLTDLPTQTDALGTCRIRFSLPESIERGEGLLSVAVDDGGTRETTAKTIPINLGKVLVDFYPEGGRLVAGLTNRVYFHGHDPLGEPVHVEGRVVDSDGTEVARVRTQYEGRGRFEFAPRAGEEYRLQIENPLDVAEEPKLPALRPGDDLLMATGTGVFDAGQPLSVRIKSREARDSLVVAAVCRGVSVGNQQVRFSPADDSRQSAEQTIELPVAEDVSGVVRVTVFDYRRTPPQPLAERLVYCRPARRLKVDVVGGQREYSPGDPVTLSLQVTDERGKAAPAVLGLSVVDEALLNLADDKSPRMETQFRLAEDIQDVEQLEDANFYLSASKEATEAMDLLLGTQGWRTFNDVTADDLASTFDSGVAKSEEARSATVRNKIARVADADGDLPASGLRPEQAEQVEVAEEMLSGTFVAERDGESSAVAEAPLALNNLPQVSQLFDRAFREFQNNRQRQLSSAGLWIVAIGVGVLVLLSVMGLLRLSAGRRVWLPAVVVTAGCMLVGLSWISARVTSRGELVVGPLSPPASSQLVALLDDFESVDGRGIESWGEHAPTKLEAVTGVMDLATIEELELNADMSKLLPVQLEKIQRGDKEAFTRDILGASREPNWYFGDLDLAQAGDANGFGLFNRQPDPRFGAYRFNLPTGGVAGFAGGAMGGGGFGMGGPDGQLYGGGPAGYPLAGQWADMLSDSRLRRLTVPVDGQDRGVFFDGELAGDPAIGGQQDFDVDGILSARLGQMRFAVRQYAHQPPPRTADQPRRDFQESLYWNPLLLADASGKAEVEFGVSDLVTSFQVRAEAHGKGRLGQMTSTLVSRLPFTVEPKLPLEVTAGDRIDLPVAINNDTDQPLKGRLLLEQGDALQLSGPAEIDWNLDANERGREYYPLEVVGIGSVEVQVRGSSGSLSDQVRRTLTSVPAGFPLARAYAGQLDGEQEIDIQLAEGIVPGSLQVVLRAFPSALADLRRGVEGLLREPSGCFEQTSSSNYPNLMALRFMQEHGVADPEFTRRSRELLKRGYAKLVGFECSDRGYEWFGGSPGHEALTAYGLMEFHDMQGVWDVDTAMVQRTAEWLMKRRDGQGGFQRNAKSLDSFGAAPQEVTDAYIVWALSEAGQTDLQPELQRVLATALRTDDAYVLALAAGAAWNLQPQADENRNLFERLVALQDKDGSLEGKLGTITSSGGLAKKVETTALAALAWMKSDRHPEAAQKAVRWLIDNRDASGTFGSTQATILALKVLVEDARRNRREVGEGELIVYQDGKPIGRAPVSAGQSRVVEVEGLQQHLQSGANAWKIELKGGNKMPYLLEVAYRGTKPDSHPDCPLRLVTRLGTDRIRAGESVTLEVELSNVSGTGQPMSVAIIGLPAGLEPRVERLDELREQGVFDFYELRGREVILYWRGVGPDVRDQQALKFQMDLTAEIPGTYAGPASRTYLYYTAEQKTWVEPLRVEIARP